MFVDIMGASEVSNYKKPADYAKFVSDFQALFKATCSSYVEEWLSEHRDYVQYSARGDEGLFMLYAEDIDTAEGVDLGINIALDLKRRWLCSDENRLRILDFGLLPIDLGIGIHTGVTYLEKTDNKPTGNPGGYEPEGYTINLAKRIEGHSREGSYSHIFLSEAAHGRVMGLADEMTYLFDDPHTISPKGISRNIRVYEVKHHFLPSDWQEEHGRSGRAKTLLDEKATVKDVIDGAVKLNPTNRWLAEESIRSSLLQSFFALKPNERNDIDLLREAFQPALEQAQRLSQSEQRDAGSLFILGLVEGECNYYDRERQRYQAAINDTDQLGEAYWYTGLSYSYELYFEALDENLDVTRAELNEKHPDYKDFPDRVLQNYREAMARRPQCAWMLYDYGCEFIRWAQNDQDELEGINKVELAVKRLPAVKEAIPTEPYLSKVLKHPIIRDLL